MVRKISLGDIFELKTEKGLAYIQYVLKDPYHSYLVRVLDGVFKTRPSVFSELVRKKEIYYEFVPPLLYELNKKIIAHVGCEEVPEKFKTMPVFRIIGFPDNETQKVNSWRIWENGKERFIGKLTAKYLDTPTLSLSGTGGVAHSIEEGYTPRNDWNVTGLIPEIHAKLFEKSRWDVDNKDKK